MGHLGGHGGGSPTCPGLADISLTLCPFPFFLMPTQGGSWEEAWLRLVAERLGLGVLAPPFETQGEVKGDLCAKAMQWWVPPAKQDSYFIVTSGCLLHARPCIRCWDVDVTEPTLQLSRQVMSE